MPTTDWELIALNRALKWFLSMLIAILAVGTTMRVLRNAATPENESSSPGQPSEGEPKGSDEIIIGIEYVVHGLGKGLSDLGISAVKPLPETFSWDKMQKGPDDSIDFSVTDSYVAEYQACGFEHIVLGLRVQSDLIKSPWMVDKRYPKTQAVDPQYHDRYTDWVGSLVERYDMDGHDDMPGLLYPIRHYEIGVEFSSYQPEPTDVYLETLELGYRAAHRACGDVLIGHSAFLLTPVFRDDPGPGDYEKAFAENLVGTGGKQLSDIRKVLDRPDLFDVLNVHNLGWPYEIERIVRWLDYETGRRGYSKPIIISDTAPTSFAGMGSATRCEGLGLAVMLPPATEADRCRLAEYFKRLINNDPEYISWLRRYLASDVVQRVVMAAEQGVALIDTAFTGDIPGAALAIFQAAAGNCGWGGMVDYKTDFVKGINTVTGRRPAYYALQQLQANINGYTSITRIHTNGDLRLYRVERAGTKFLIAWYAYQRLYLPDDLVPSKIFPISVASDSVVVEELKLSEEVSRTRFVAVDGVLELQLTPEPVYIFEQ